MARDNIRNFCIIAHIDHGKSTLSDRMLELTDSVDKRTMTDQVLDNMELEKQQAIIRQLELPCAALVYSGSKSLHAIVRVGAPDYTEYRRRVDYLYAACKKNGLTLDEANRNPARLSRMPGILRGGKKQYLLETNTGKSCWEEWKDWFEACTDDLPDTENLADDWASLPPLADALIEGVLRQGHKMLLAGPSKAGKSFALIELCICLAEGAPWLGRFACAQGFAALGADARSEGRLLYLGGSAKLHGATVTAPDLRGGAALVLAGLGVRDGSCVRVLDAGHIRRGYADLAGDLRRLGADCRAGRTGTEAGRQTKKL